MKIIGGKLKGRTIHMPKDIRPTQNIVREALFDILGHDLEGVRFLDLFAGSGAMGIEALSRGAQAAVLVDKDPLCVKMIQKNLQRLTESFPMIYAVFEKDVFAAIKYFAQKNTKFDIVFIDPPYDRHLGKKALKTLGGYDILHPNYTIIIEHTKSESLPETEGRFRLFRQKKYGSTYLSIYKSQG